jgi:hypothetical protein
MTDVQPVAPSDDSGDSVAKVAQELRDGTLLPDAAEVRLQALSASSVLTPPAKTGDAAFAAEASDDWMKPTDDNNPNRLLGAGIKDAATFARLHRALVGGPDSTESSVSSG